ncbi:ATP-binding cassette domain-containing protein [Pedobacter cryoconitis]|uniref:Molybdate transport system ATP-binding protein n=1 Tax=Pedobacter cryoconitis TaxID=188932 RepID=A0A7X0J013_9SPHI|nr:ATP-binding cassette domain-containing protein [Pedobacter cryoconitis]MBB6498595.1 molybdate transport system ATP-binding protein [Pedobacter cryoconitis]
MIEAAIYKKIKTYRGTIPLVIEAQFPAQSVTRIYGPSGSGKTTFLKILAGLITPEKGVITVNDRCWLDTVRKINLSPQERKVGFVFQDYALFPNMTVEGHLRYATQDMALIDRLLLIGKMESFRKQKPAHLSGGQQQRLAILRALAQKPGLLVLDEAFSALDDELREELITELKIILKEFKTTTIIVSHHLQETAGFADRALKIEQGI